MTTFNVTSGGRSQVLVDEQQLKQLQAELTRRGMELERLKSSMETLSAINVPAHFMAASMALCNEMASRWHAERVGLGILKGRYVRLKALSHTEKITRNMQLVQDIESAMEECLDQDVEIILPPPKEASFVYRMGENLSSRHGPSAIISLPLRRERIALKERSDERFGNVVAVLTVERKIDKPFTLQEIEALRLTCDLFTSRLIDLYEHDRWIGAKALRGTRKVLAWAVGAKHTWAKVAAIAVSGFLAFALLVDGTFRVDAPFTMKAKQKQSITSPIDAQLKTVNVDVGDMVVSEQTAALFDELNALNPLAATLPIKRPATVLATLDTLELRSKREERNWKATQADHAASIARNEGKTAEAQQNEFEAASIRAEIATLDAMIESATIKAPFDGIVFQGDLHTKLGVTVKTGDQLFEIGQSDLRAELSIPEDQIMDVKVGQTGVLKTTSAPDHPIKFTVERINPIASVVSSKNVFNVRVRLDEPQSPLLKEGVEGLAKIDVEKSRYAWIWTHRMINWARMKIWMLW